MGRAEIGRRQEMAEREPGLGAGLDEMPALEQEQVRLLPGVGVAEAAKRTNLGVVAAANHRAAMLRSS